MNVGVSTDGERTLLPPGFKACSQRLLVVTVHSWESFCPGPCLSTSWASSTKSLTRNPTTCFFCLCHKIPEYRVYLTDFCLIGHFYLNDQCNTTEAWLHDTLLYYLGHKQFFFICSWSHCYQGLSVSQQGKPMTLADSFGKSEIAWAVFRCFQAC